MELVSAGFVGVGAACATRLAAGGRISSIGRLAGRGTFSTISVAAGTGAGTTFSGAMLATRMAEAGGSKPPRRGALSASERGAKSRDNVSSVSSRRGLRVTIRGAEFVCGAGAIFAANAISGESVKIVLHTRTMVTIIY